MKEKEPLTTHDFERFSIEGKDIYVQANNYPEAKKWFDEHILQAGIKIQDIFPDASVEGLPRIIRVENVDQLDIVTKANSNALEKFFTKGYDFNSDSYIFTMLDVYKQKHQVIAPTFEEAERKIQDGKVLLDTTVPKVYSTKVYSCDEEKAVVIDGESIEIFGEEDLIEQLKELYPDGVTVRLMDESLENLKAYSFHDEEEMCKVMGMIDADPETRMLKCHGSLEAELRLKPREYDILYACEETYYCGELSDLGFDTGVNATTMMLNSEEGLKEARIETFVCDTLLNNLYIENIPYKEVMEMVGQYKIESESELQLLLYHNYLDKEPDWKQRLAADNSRDAIHKFWVEKVGPAFREQQEKYNETLETAAKENGYECLADYKRDIGWSKDPSPEIVERFNKILERHMELYKPYEKKVKAISIEMDILKARLQRNYCINFDRAARNLVSEVKFIPRMGTDWAVRCKIGGVQQSGRLLDKADAENLFKRERPANFLHDMAVKYFKDDINNSMQQQRSNSLHR